MRESDQEEDVCFSRKETAIYITKRYRSVTANMLAIWQHRNRHPSLSPIKKGTHVFYPKKAVDQWLKDKFTP